MNLWHYTREPFELDRRVPRQLANQFRRMTFQVLLTRTRAIPRLLPRSWENVGQRGQMLGAGRGKRGAA